MTKKKILGIVAAIFVLALIIIQAGAFNASAIEKLKFGTPLKLSPIFYLPYSAAEEGGFWRLHGLEVEVVPFESGTMLNRAVATGAINIGMTMAITSFQAVAGGLPLVIVSDLYPSDDFFIWVPAKSPLREAKDLKGTRIGIIGFGGSAHAYGRLVVKTLGMEKDVRFVSTGGVLPGIGMLKTGGGGGLRAS